MKEQEADERAQVPGEPTGSTKLLALFLVSLFIAWSIRATLLYRA